jgi:hypothetical protein
MHKYVYSFSTKKKYVYSFVTRKILFLKKITSKKGQNSMYNLLFAYLSNL